MDSRIKNVFSNRSVILLGHIVAWTLVLLLPYFMPMRKLPPMPNPMPMPPMENGYRMDIMFRVHFASNAALIFFFYLNYYFLIPKFLYRKSAGWYFLTLVGCFFVFQSYRSVIEMFFMGFSFPSFSPFWGIFPILFTFTISLAMRVTRDRLREEQKRKEQETENLKSELSFLRSQISPHFLFNMMNNIVALSRLKPHLVEPTVVQLSHLMRYMLYESDENKVSLDKELEYLDSYIALQKMRFGKMVNIQFEKKIPQNTEGGIEPMLLIPFVENAFKHGVGLISEPFIKINLLIENNELIFNVLNKYSPESNEEKDSASGIGLRNVMRRLALLYKEKHTLNIEQKGELFEVNLTIHLTEINNNT